MYIYFILYTCKFNSFKTRCESLVGLPESRLPGCSFLVAVGSQVGDVDRENAHWARQVAETHISCLGGQLGAHLEPCYWAEQLQSWCCCRLQRPGQIRDTQEVNFLERERGTIKLDVDWYTKVSDVPRRFSTFWCRPLGISQEIGNRMRFV
jgi:hypothetical protein